MGTEARRLFDDAQVLLKDIVENKKITLRGMIGFYPANSVGDDIEIYTSEDRNVVGEKFYTLRQQAEKDTDEPYLAMSDFIAPKESNIRDYLGMFVASAGFGVEVNSQSE